jgi:glutamyl/glutaminyl-tRNA synthetase
MLNYLAFLGWNPGDKREYLSKEELVTAFDLAKVHKGSAIFDEVKLQSVNQYWMRTVPDAEFITRGQLSPEALPVVPLLKERAKTFGEARELITGELSCLFVAPKPTKELLLAKEPSAGKTKEYLEHAVEILPALAPKPSVDAVKESIMPYAEQEGRGAVLWPLRYALSGQERSPDPFTLISVLGIEEAANRIQNAIAILQE